MASVADSFQLVRFTMTCRFAYFRPGLRLDARRARRLVQDAQGHGRDTGTLPGRLVRGARVATAPAVAMATA